MESREDILQQDEEYARRIMEQVHRVERPVETPPCDESKEQEEQEEQETKSGGANILWLILSGDILVSKRITKYYGQLLIVAVLALLSIIVMFSSLHLDVRHEDLVREEQLLRERSIRIHESYMQRSSIEAIEAEIKRKDIDLERASRPATIIEKKRSWW